MNFIARSPLSRGLLSERYINKSFSFGSEDFRSTLPRKWITWVRSNVKNLKLTATEKENLSKIALQYCSGFPEVSVVIPGIKQQHHLEACLKTQSSDFLSRSLMSRIESDTEPYYPDWG